MYNNFKTEFKPYLDTLKEDNTTLKNHFNQVKVGEYGSLQGKK